MFSDELTKYQEAHQLVEVYTNAQNTSKFNVGYILAHDDDFFLMSSVSRFGRFDGFELQKTEDIIRLTENSIYLKKLMTLMRFHNEKQGNIVVGQDLVYEILDYCKTNNRIVSIEVVDSDNVDTRGYIDDLDYDKCTIHQISEFGKNDGVSHLLLKDMTNVCCGSEMEVMLEILNSELFDEKHSG